MTCRKQHPSSTALSAIVLALSVLGATPARAEDCGEQVARAYEACMAAGIKDYNSSQLGSGNFSYISRCTAQRDRELKDRCRRNEQSEMQRENERKAFDENSAMREQELLEERVRAAHLAGCTVDRSRISQDGSGFLNCDRPPGGTHQCSTSNGAWTCVADARQLRALEGDYASRTRTGPADAEPGTAPWIGIWDVRRICRSNVDDHVFEVKPTSDGSAQVWSRGQRYRAIFSSTTMTVTGLLNATVSYRLIGSNTGTPREFVGRDEVADCTFRGLKRITPKATFGVRG